MHQKDKNGVGAGKDSLRLRGYGTIARIRLRRYGTVARIPLLGATQHRPIRLLHCPPKNLNSLAAAAMADRIATTEAGMAAGEGMLRDEGAWKDVFTFEKRDSMVLAVIRALSSHGVDTSGVQAVDKLAKEGRKTKSKLYGRPLTDEEQQRAVYKCGERPYFLPRCMTGMSSTIILQPCYVTHGVSFVSQGIC